MLIEVAAKAYLDVSWLIPIPVQRFRLHELSDNTVEVRCVQIQRGSHCMSACIKLPTKALTPFAASC